MTSHVYSLFTGRERVETQTPRAGDAQLPR